MLLSQSSRDTVTCGHCSLHADCASLSLCLPVSRGQTDDWFDLSGRSSAELGGKGMALFLMISVPHILHGTNSLGVYSQRNSSPSCRQELQAPLCIGCLLSCQAFRRTSSRAQADCLTVHARIKAARFKRKPGMLYSFTNPRCAEN
jgi:hypothetical protein